jgi:hypothetical protein
VPDPINRERGDQKEKRTIVKNNITFEFASHNKRKVLKRGDTSTNKIK